MQLLNTSSLEQTVFTLNGFGPEAPSLLAPDINVPFKMAI